MKKFFNKSRLAVILMLVILTLPFSLIQKNSDNLFNFGFKKSVVEASGTITLDKTNYPQYKVFQRDEQDYYTFSLTGTYSGSCIGIEASFAGREYFTIDTSVSTGIFNGQFVETSGQGPLTVRCMSDSSLTDTALDIGIGDVYVVAGQSNAEGHAQFAQQYTTIAPTSTIFPVVYTEADLWKVGNDDTDPGGGAGSVWPILGGYMVKNTGVPVAFITTATGGRGLVNPTHWKKGGVGCINPTLNCYDNMVNQVTESGVNAVKAILWFQGEQDAANNVSQADYNAGLDLFTSNAKADLPGNPVLVAGVIGAWQPNPLGAERIRLATIEAWDDNPDILFGPETYDYNIISDGSGDLYHFSSNAQIRGLGFRWWKALEEHFYGGTDGRGPVATSARKINNNTKIEVTFTDATLPLLPSSGLSTSVWRVKDNGVVVPVTTAIVSNDKVTLTLASPANGATTLDYAYENSGEAQSVLKDSVVGNLSAGTNYLPADPFTGMSVEEGPSLLYSGNFTESNTNNGSVNGSVVVNILNDTFVNPLVLGQHVEVLNYPEGLTPVLTRNNDNQVSIRLTGNAVNHSTSNNTNAVTIVWLNGAFTNTPDSSLVTNNIKDDIRVKFIRFGIMPTIKYENIFINNPKETLKDQDKKQEEFKILEISKNIHTKI